MPYIFVNKMVYDLYHVREKYRNQEKKNENIQLNSNNNNYIMNNILISLNTNPFIN